MYSAEVVVGITNTGEAVFYDVVDLTPAKLDIKKRNPLPPLLRKKRLAIYKGTPIR